VVIYQAPIGALPTLRLVDITGRQVLSVQLPAGTGAEQSAVVSVREVASGTYLLELSDRSERVALPIMISK
jgi:hypothetical protein